MVNALWSFEAFFSELGRAKAVALGVGISMIFCAAGALLSPSFGFGVAFLLYFPFHIWLTVSLFLVVFSKLERDRLLGPGWSAFGSFLGCLFSAYGWACMGFFYSLIAWMWATGAIE